jgi:hypothetical protein
MLLGTAPAWAVGGDFSINFAAAHPATYDHATGGGSWYEGFVTSLQGGSFQDGDIVSWLALITVRSSAVGKQTIQLDFSFAAVNTGHPGAKLKEVVGVQITDVDHPPDNANGGGSLVNQVTPPVASTDKVLRCSVQVTDLDPGEKVVIRINTLLVREYGSSPTGNLWGQLDSGTVIDPEFSGKDATISTGKQTVPFQKVGDIARAGLVVVKKVSLATQTQEQAVDSLTVGQGTQVKYWITVTNTGNVAVSNIKLTDSEYGDITADLGLSGGSLAAGASATAVLTKTITSTVTNTATAKGDNSVTGEELTGSDSATVTVMANELGSRTINVTLEVTELTRESATQLTGKFTIKNNSGTDVKVLGFSLAVAYKGPDDTAWTTVSSGNVSTDFSPTTVASISNGSTVEVSFQCTLTGVPEGAVRVTPGIQVEGL